MRRLGCFIGWAQLNALVSPLARIFHNLDLESDLTNMPRAQLHREKSSINLNVHHDGDNYATLAEIAPIK